MELLIATLLGTISGVMVGLLPGFGMSLCLLILSPFLIQQSLIFCLLFYCCASSSSQYFGSVTTLCFRIPGETTSLPLIELMKNEDFMKRKGDVYFLTSFGSFFASIFSGLLILLFFEYFFNFTLYLKSYIIFIFCILGFILCIFFSENKILVSIILFFFGWIVSKIGYDDLQETNFLTFDNVYLYGGIPTLPIIMGLYAIPSLFKMFSYIRNIQKSNDIFIELSSSKTKIILEHYKTIIISSIVGFFMGLLPYIGSGMSSYVSFFIDKKRNSKNFISNAVASETANNSANISVLIPLIFLGIAIIPSEFLLLEILPLGNNVISIDQIKPYYTIMFFLLLISNIGCFYFSWVFIRPMWHMISCLNFFVPIILICFIIFGILYIGNDYNQLFYYLTIFCISSIIGLLLKNYDLIPFVYAFMLQNQFENILYRISSMYF